MNKLILLTQAKPDAIINNFSGLMFTAAAVTGVIVLIRGVYNGLPLKRIAGQIITISVVAGITIKPMVFASIGTTIIDFFLSLTKSLTI